jgi:redox-sensitive bicupin YhaK (pirin superfamily)
MTTRTVKQLHRALSDDIGDLRTQRPLPNASLEQLDPFLFLNHHGPQVYPPENHGLPFGPHPHRGFETVTFIVEGSLMHRDTAGHESVIEAGGVQWMTAGRGVEHAELSPEEFLRSGGPLEILQLWVNLPSRLKMADPRYTGLQQEAIPSHRQPDGVNVNLVSGDWSGHRGPIETLTDVTMMTVEFPAGGKLRLETPVGRTIFLYVVRGALRVGDTLAPELHLVEMNDDGDSFEIEAVEPSMILFGHAAPLHEPVVAHGPFVMNTHEEIVQAIRDYQAGAFRGVSVI